MRRNRTCAERQLAKTRMAEAEESNLECRHIKSRLSSFQPEPPPTPNKAATERSTSVIGISLSTKAMNIISDTTSSTSKLTTTEIDRDIDIYLFIIALISPA